MLVLRGNIIKKKKSLCTEIFKNKKKTNEFQFKNMEKFHHYYNLLPLTDHKLCEHKSTNRL